MADRGDEMLAHLQGVFQLGLFGLQLALALLA